MSKGSCAVCLHYDWMKEECKLTDCEYVMAAEVLDCAYKKLCKVNDTKNCVHKDSWECPMADKIRDALNDAVPFYDPDEDLPEEDEEEP